MNDELRRQCMAELIGTFLLVFFGCGAVFSAVLAGALQGLFQVAIVWGIAIAVTIYALAAISGAHINPAVTIAVWALRGFPARKVGPYIGSQTLGAFLAAAVLYMLYAGVLAGFERERGIVRGRAGSEVTACIFGEYFPNPGLGTTPEAYAKVSMGQAMAGEIIGTAMLVFFVFGLTDQRNAGRPNGTLAALFIGLTVSILIAVIAPLTQAGFNPARDFGPRVFAYLAGWGAIAIPGPRGGFFTVYILSPVIGGQIGGMLHDRILRPRTLVASAAETTQAVEA